MGWSENPNSTTAEFQSGETFNIGSRNSATLYAIWTNSPPGRQVTFATD